jgi:hypothetical protein
MSARSAFRARLPDACLLSSGAGLPGPRLLNIRLLSYCGLPGTRLGASRIVFGCAWRRWKKGHRLGTILCDLETRKVNISEFALDHPKFYSLRVSLLAGNTLVHRMKKRIAFWTAVFTKDGFEHNGKVVRLFGLNRHHTFPSADTAMRARVEDKDARIP